jgi:ubiquinone/menaquinone biosynthesis C-methylase UbiE
VAVFNPENRKKLNNPERLKWIPPEKLVQYMKLSGPCTIVDFGAGTGFFSAALVKLLPEARIYAIDSEPLMIDEMQTQLPQGKRIIPQLNPPGRIELPDHIADALFSINVFHELNEPDEVLKDFHRILKPGGMLLIIDWEKNEHDCVHGPALIERIHSTEAAHIIRNAGFAEVKINSGLKYHYAVTAEVL